MQSPQPKNHREVNVLIDCETFIYAFRLAAKIMIDVLTEEQMREI